MGVRVRLRFDSSPLHYSRQCWFLFDPDSCSVVGDVAFLIADHFNLRRSGLRLYMDGYLLPAKESAQIIRDNDALQVRGAEYSESSGSSSEEERPPAKRRKGEREKEVKLAKTNKRRLKVRENTAEESLPVRRKRKGGVEEGAEGGAEPGGSGPKKVVGQAKKKPQIASAANEQSFQKDNALTNTQIAGTLHAVTSTLASGAQRTVFHSSSSSESEGPDEVQTHRQPVIPLSGTKSPRETQWDKRPDKSVDKGAGAAPRSFSGRKRKFPRVVGGPNDIHTTRSTVYKRQEQNGDFFNSRQSKSDKDNGGNAVSKDSTGQPSVEEIAAVTLERESVACVPTVSEGGVRELGVMGEGVRGEGVMGEGVRGEGVMGEGVRGEGVSGEGVSGEGVRDYSTLSELSGAPRVGDRIAFKVLELTSSYTPELSAYKEARVLGFDGVSKTVRLKYTATTLGRERERVARGNVGKFSLPDDPDTALEPAPEVDIPLDSMMETKLLSLN